MKRFKNILCVVDTRTSCKHALQRTFKLAENNQAHMIVMGTVGRTVFPGLIMGNTAETILNDIDCSVLAIKPPDFETPVTLMD